MPSVEFFSEDIDFSLPKPRKTSAWIKSIVSIEGKKLLALNYIFCSDNYLYIINRKSLKHKTFTDIITFDNSDDAEVIEGDIFISIERVRDNSKKFNTPFQQELHRVIIHGVLHLVGYGDKNPLDKTLMRKKEDACLSLPNVPRETFT